MNQDKSNAPSNVASGFLSHLIELRDRLLRTVIVVSVAFIALFPFAKDIYNWLAAPLVNQGQEMLIIGPVAPFLVPMKLTLLVAFLITLPYLFYQLWSFVAPGLYKHEKRLVYPLLASSIFLFYLGIAFVYYLLLPMMFQIIPTFAPDIAKYSPDIAQYLDFTMMMFIAFGFGFEMPIATILLISTGMTTAESLQQKRPYIIVAAFVVGMFLTPPDVISQIMLAVPMWLLFEIGLIFSKFFDVRIKEASKAREDIDSSDQTTATASATTATIAADKLWEDDKYTYEEDSSDASKDNSIFDDYKDDDSFDTSTPSSEKDEKNSSTDSNDEDIISDEEKFFNESNEFTELTDEEMDAELDRIEALEKAEKKIKKKAKKRAKKKAKAKKEKKQNNKNKGK